MNKRTLFLGAVAALVLAFAGAIALYSVQQEKAAATQASANQAVLLREHAPSLGPRDAPVVIVEFLDPACETCRAFYPLVKTMLAAHPDKIRLVLRYAPFHPGSDKVVTMLEAARRQGKFWPALETLLAAQAEWAPRHAPDPALVWKVLARSGFDMERLAFDMTAPEITRLIAQDLADARALKVTKTPEFFVNGRPLPSFGAEPLQKLVDDALAVARK